MVLTFLTVTEKPFPQAMQFCTSLSSAHFLVRDCDCLIYTTTKPTTQSSKSSNLAKYVSTFVSSLVCAFLLLLFFKLAVLHDWPAVTGSLCQAPAWLLWCLPVSSSAPPLWPAVSRFHLHPLHTWTQPEDTKECMFKFNLAKVVWTEAPRNWNSNTPQSHKHDLNPTPSRTSIYLLWTQNHPHRQRWEAPTTADQHRTLWARTVRPQKAQCPCILPSTDHDPTPILEHTEDHSQTHLLFLLGPF